MAGANPNPDAKPAPGQGSGPEPPARPDPGSPDAGAADVAGAAGDTGLRGGTSARPTGRPGAGEAAEPPERTWTVLIAALGGEGGGVLSSWLVDAASADGRIVQATSVPGVAQRTGATTYYLEIGPRREHEGTASEGSPAGGLDAAAAATPIPPSGEGVANGSGSDSGSDSGAHSGGRVMALLPTPGNVDLLVASELLEAGRAAQNGMITPDRTTVIASTHRMFAIAEKSAMGDGRFNDERVRRAVRELSRRHVLTDLGKVAERAGTVLSSVLLGAIAGSGALPISRERLRGSIERAGIAVEANQRGFDAGYQLFEAGAAEDGYARSELAVDLPPPASAPEGAGARAPSALAARLDALPEPVREFARMGVDRTLDYQDPRYAALYLDRIEGLLARMTGADAPSTASPEDGHGAARETARQLALWMCFEDLIRVADLKTRRSRIERVRAEVRAKPGQPVAITEFLKPGVDEWCSVLPAWLARPILRAAERGGWRRRLNVGLHVRTSTVSGFLLLWTLARLRRLRRGMHRFREEQARIEGWLGQVAEAYAASPALALEVAKCASLVKGYGDTHERGVRNFERTMGCLAACAAAPDPAARPARAPRGGARRSGRDPARRRDGRARGRGFRGRRLKRVPAEGSPHDRSVSTAADHGIGRHLRRSARSTCQARVHVGGYRRVGEPLHLSGQRAPGPVLEPQASLCHAVAVSCTAADHNAVRRNRTP